MQGKEDKLYNLKKVLYGMKQASRAWNTRITAYFQENGSKESYDYAM